MVKHLLSLHIFESIILSDKQGDIYRLGLLDSIFSFSIQT